MCYNCGCKMPNNLHGKKANIINKSIRESAEAMGIPYETALKNISELIDVELAEHALGEVHGHGVDHDHDHDHSQDNEVL